MRTPNSSAFGHGDSCSTAGGPLRSRIGALAKGVEDHAGNEDLLATRFIISDELALESENDTHVTVVNKALATRLKLSRAVYRFVLGFETPRRIEEVVAAGSAVRVLPQVRMLVGKRMLIDADAPPVAKVIRLRTAVPYKFCSVPGYVKAAAVPDFVVLGVPYDLAGSIDSRLAPAAIRQKSLDYLYQVQFDSGRPQGWFDVNNGAWMLRGATIADAGDVHVEYGENQGDLFERIRAALGEACAERTVPIVLGGDRSVTYASVEGLRDRRPLTVVQFAATPAIAAAENAGVVAADGIGRRLLRIEGVERFISLGACGETVNESPCDGLVLRSASDLRQYRSEEVLREWGEDLAIHLSIDLSVATAAYMKPNAAGAPHGLALHEIKALIEALGNAHRIVSIDLVGLDMQSEAPALSAVIACHLALAAMSAAHDRSRGRR